MSYLKVSPDLFVGDIELNRLIKSLDSDGFRKLFLKNSISFGVFDNSIDGDFDNFLVQSGTNVGSIKHNEGFAVDENGLIIYRAATDNIALTNDNLWYWIKIAHAYSSTELGTVSIDISGNLTGVGTEFLSILRGTNNAVRVAFVGSSLNTAEYEVNEVISNTSAVLSGDFLSESNLQLKVIGAFTPDISVPSGSKEPFQYDSCTFSIVAEVVSETPPTLASGEYVIARVKRNGAAVVIEDKRSLNIYKDKADYITSNIIDVANPLIGIESISFDHSSQTRTENVVALQWAFNSYNWTIDTNTNKITLNAGSGGKFKTTADFTDGDFDGWRVYDLAGTYSIVQSSYKSGFQINLILATLEPTKFATLGELITVTPDFEEIQIKCSPVGSGIDTLYRIFDCAINGGGRVFNLPVFAATVDYVITYRYKLLNSYGEFRDIPADVTNGYTNENGGTTTYASNTITLIQANNAYTNLVTSDAVGVEYVLIDTTGNPVTDFIVGTRKHHVVITNDPDIAVTDSDYGLTYSLTANAFLNLKTTTPDSLKNGDSFLIEFRGDYDLNGFQFTIVQDYINAGSTGHPLHILTQDELDEGAFNNLLFKLTFNGDNWTVVKFISFDPSTTIVKSPDNVQLYTTVLPIGIWNMASTGVITVAHGLTLSKIRSWSVLIIRDDGALFSDLDKPGPTSGNNAGYSQLNATNLVLARVAFESYDSVDYDSGVVNRGYITIIYQE